MVDDLLRARKTLQPIAPLTTTYGDFPPEEAYAVQAAVTARLARGTDRAAGYKIAGASPAARQAWGLTEPIYGALLASMETPEGGSAQPGTFCALAVEAEIAFVVARDVDRPLASVAELKPYVRSVHVALDLADNRFQGEPKAADRIADAAGAGRYVLGKPLDPRRVDVDRLVATLKHQGKVVYRGQP